MKTDETAYGDGIQQALMPQIPRTEGNGYQRGKPDDALRTDVAPNAGLSGKEVQAVHFASPFARAESNEVSV